MPGISYNDAGTWREITVDIAYNDAGTWRSLSEVHYNDAGTWREVWPSSGGGGGGAVVSIAAHTVNDYGGAGGVGYRLNSSGAAENFTGGVWSSYAGEWKISGAASDYECRATETSGTVTSGTVGTWQVLSSTRTWTVIASAGLTKTTKIRVEIRDVATSTVQDTAVITLFHDNV